MGHWRQRRTHRARVAEMTAQPIGVVHVAVGSAGYNGVVRFTVVGQDVPTLLPVGVVRTLQARLDLDDNGDKVIFRQF